MAEVFWAEVTGGVDLEAVFPAHGHILTCAWPGLEGPEWTEWIKAETYLWGLGLELYMAFRPTGESGPATQYVMASIGLALARGSDQSVPLDPWDIDWLQSQSYGVSFGTGAAREWEGYGNLAVVASGYSPPPTPSFMSQRGKVSLRLSVSDTGLITATSDGASSGTSQINATFWAAHDMIGGTATPLMPAEWHEQERDYLYSSRKSYGRRFEWHAIEVDWGGTYLTGAQTVIDPVVTPTTRDHRWRVYPATYCVGDPNTLQGAPYPGDVQTGQRSWQLGVAGGGDNLLRMPNGAELVLRTVGAQQVHRRQNYLEAFETAVHVGAGAGKPLGCQAGALHVVRQADAVTRISEDVGRTYADAPSDHPVYLVRSLRDRDDLVCFRVDRSGATGLGLTFDGGNLVAVALDGTETVIAAAAGQAMLEQLADGRWLAGVFSGNFTSWLSGDGVTWAADRSETLSKSDVAHLVTWLCESEQQLAAGWHETDETIYLWHRPSAAVAWSAPVTVATGVADEAVPYVCQRPDGAYEVGWLQSGWQQRLSDDLATWSAP